MLQSEIAWHRAGREVSAGKAEAMVMESLSHAVGSGLPFAACPRARAGAPVSVLGWPRMPGTVWHGRATPGASGESLPGARWAGGACTAFPAKGGSRLCSRLPAKAVLPSI